jgi:cephalosporin hydroxylase
VLRELRAWVPKLRAGDYLVVEDTVVNGHPVRAEHGPGPWEAIEDYLAEAPGLLAHDAVREAKFGATAAVRGYYARVGGE